VFANYDLLEDILLHLPLAGGVSLAENKPEKAVIASSTARRTNLRKGEGA